jgi:hypothetical protein
VQIVLAAPRQSASELSLPVARGPALPAVEGALSLATGSYQSDRRKIPAGSRATRRAPERYYGRDASVATSHRLVQ